MMTTLLMLTGLLITVDAVWADINIIADVDCSAECPTELLVSIIDGFHQIYKRRETGITILSICSLFLFFLETPDTDIRLLYIST